MRVFFQDQLGIGGTPEQTALLSQEFARHGHTVTVSPDPEQLVGRFELAILNHVSIHISPFYQTCKLHGIPFIVKPIFYQAHPMQPDTVAALADSMAVAAESPAEASYILDRIAPFATTTEMERVQAKLRLALPAIHPAIENRGSPVASRPLVHSNGRYTKNKNFPLVIRACRDLGLPLVVAGEVTDSPWDPGNYDECVALDYGTLLPYQTKSDLCNIYNKTRVYVCSSLNEVCSTSVCEAIACGCQVVASAGNMGNSNFDNLLVFDTYRDLVAGLDEVYRLAENQQNPYWRPEDLYKSYMKMFMSSANLLL